VSLLRILWCALLLSTTMAIAQSPDAVKYAPRPILLMSSEKDVEGVMPMLFVVDGQQHIEFVLISKIKESMDKGGQPIRLGDVLSALGEATETINKLQAENDRLRTENEKLWKVAMKDAPQPQPPTVVVQQTAPQKPSPLERYMLLRSLVSPIQPYRLPAPVNPNANRIQTNCTTRMVGDTSVTDCH
jgi:regulator of replication initiation timing